MPKTAIDLLVCCRVLERIDSNDWGQKIKLLLLLLTLLRQQMKRDNSTTSPNYHAIEVYTVSRLQFAGTGSIL